MPMTKKRYLLATAGSVASVAAAAGTAQAAPPPPAPMMWSGFYIGGNLGVAWQKMSSPWDATTEGKGATQTSGNSFIGGGQIGFNWQSGNAVYGVEGDFQGLTGTASNFSTNKGNSGISTKMNWLSTLRGRLGLAVDNSLFYVTGGVAWASINNTLNAGCPSCVPGIKSFSNVHTGWVVGAGVEQMIAPHWTVGLEGLWVNFGTTSSFTTFPQGQKGSTFQNQVVIGRVKLNYKF
jgi:outer membrane immunogenic protein